MNASGVVLDRGLLIEQTGLQNFHSLTLHIRPLQLQAFAYAFVAVLGDGSVMTWADSGYGGDSSDVQTQLKNGQQIQASRCGSAFAAILSDRSVVTWDFAAFGGDSSAVQEQLKGVQQIQASNNAFCRRPC